MIPLNHSSDSFRFNSSNIDILPSHSSSAETSDRIDEFCQFLLDKAKDKKVMECASLCLKHKDVRYFNSIHHLDLSSSHLNELPEEIGLLSNLTHLDLSNNQLTRLPSKISNLHKLSIINLDRNKLTSIPDVLQNMSHFICLHIYDNPIRTIPPSMRNKIVAMPYLAI